LALRRRVRALIGLGLRAERLRDPFRADLAELEELVDANGVRRDVDEERLLVGEARGREEGGEREGGERCGAFQFGRPFGWS